MTLNGISHIATPDLSRDLSPEVIRMLNHSHPQIRKRSVLALYKLMLQYPDVVQPGLEKLREKLEDSDIGQLCRLFRATL